jgi:hypothetical protein
VLSSCFEGALQAALVLRREQRDDRSSSRFFRKLLEHPGHAAHERVVSVLEYEMELERGAQIGIGVARVLERPLYHLGDEFRAKARESSALGARQKHDHGAAMSQAIVEELAGQRVVFGARRQLAHVLGPTQSAHAGARHSHQLSNQLGGQRGVEQLLLARKILVEVTDRRARALCHLGHRGGFVALLREGGGGRDDERLPHVLLRNLHHPKGNNAFSFASGKGRNARIEKFRYSPATYAKASRPSAAASRRSAVIAIHSFISRPWPGSK